MGMTPKWYRNQLSIIGIDDMKFNLSSLSECTHSIERLDELEDLLLNIKRNLRMDMRSVRFDYVNRLNELERSKDKVDWFGRKPAPRRSLRKMKSLIGERDSCLGAYESIEVMLDDYLTQIECNRNYIREYMYDNFGE